MQSDAPPEQRVPLLQRELERVTAELQEATAVKAEADALGDTSLIAEMAAMEHQLQGLVLELRNELERVKAQQLASSGSALRARLAKLRESEARARSLLTSSSGSLKEPAGSLSAELQAPRGSLLVEQGSSGLPPAEPPAARGSGTPQSSQHPASTLAPAPELHQHGSGGAAQPGPVQSQSRAGLSPLGQGPGPTPMPAPVSLPPLAAHPQAALPQPGAASQAAPGSPRAEPYNWGTSGLFTRTSGPTAPPSKPQDQHGAAPSSPFTYPTQDPQLEPFTAAFPTTQQGQLVEQDSAGPSPPTRPQPGSPASSPARHSSPAPAAPASSPGSLSSPAQHMGSPRGRTSSPGPPTGSPAFRPSPLGSAGPPGGPGMEGDQLFASVSGWEGLDSHKLSQEAQQAAAHAWLDGSSFSQRGSAPVGSTNKPSLQSETGPDVQAVSLASASRPESPFAASGVSTSPEQARSSSPSKAQAPFADAWGQAGSADAGAGAGAGAGFEDAWGAGPAEDSQARQPSAQQGPQPGPAAARPGVRMSADLWGFEAQPGMEARGSSDDVGFMPSEQLGARQEQGVGSGASSASQPASSPVAGPQHRTGSPLAGGRERAQSPRRPDSHQGVELPGANASSVPTSPFAGSASQHEPSSQAQQADLWAHFAGPARDSASQGHDSSGAADAPASFSPAGSAHSAASPAKASKQASQPAPAEPMQSSWSGNPFLDFQNSGGFASQPSGPRPDPPRAASPLSKPPQQPPHSPAEPSPGQQPGQSRAEGRPDPQASGSNAHWPGLAPPGNDGLPSAEQSWASWEPEPQPRRQSGPPKVVIKALDGQEGSWASFSAPQPAPAREPADFSSRSSSPVSRAPVDDWEAGFPARPPTAGSMHSIDLGPAHSAASMDHSRSRGGGDLISFDSNAGAMAGGNAQDPVKQGLGSRLSSIKSRSMKMMSGENAKKLSGKMRTASSRLRGGRDLEGEVPPALDNPYAGSQSDFGPLEGAQRAQQAVGGLPSPFFLAGGPPKGSDLDAIQAFQPITAAERSKCEGAFHAKGFTESGGLELDAAAELYRKSGALPDQLQATFDVADVDGDGVLDLRQFCLFMVLVKALRAEDAPMLPHSLSPAQAAHLLGEPPPPTKVPPLLMPSSSTSSWVDIPPGEDPAAAQGPQPTPRTKAKSGRLGSMMSALGRKGKEDPVKDLMALGYREDDCRRALFLHANELKAARDWLLERFGAPTGPTRGLGASLGGNDSPSGSSRGSPVRQQAPRGYEFRPDPSTPTSAGGGQIKLRLEKADVSHYRKAVERPLIHVSLLDAQGRPVEASLVTPPCVFDAPTGNIVSSHTISLRTKAENIPEGSALFFEVRHYKAQEKRFSTLGWSFVPVEVLVDHSSSPSGFGATSRGLRVRSGPVYMNMYQKPVDEKAHMRLLHQTAGAGAGKKGPKPLNKNHDLFVHVSVV